MAAPPIIPQFTMGNNILPGFLQGTQGITNALGQWQARNQAADRMAQQQQQFEATNKLAQAHLGIAQRGADRADAMAPLQMQQIKAQVDHMVRSGQLEAQKAPYVLQNLIAQTQLHQAQAKKAAMGDPIDDLLRRQLGAQTQGMAPAAPMPGPGPIRPQSFDGGVMPGGVTPTASGGPQAFASPGLAPPTPQQGMQPPPGDPNLILAQTAAPTPPPPQQDNLIDVPMFGKMTEKAATDLAMGLALKKNDAGAKAIMEAVNKGQLDKNVRKKIDEHIVDAVDSLSRMQEIKAQFKPEYLTYDGKFKQYAVSWADSFETLRKKLPPDVLQAHAEYTEFRRSSISNMNLYIKAITGAQMSEGEANRLRKAIADAENDSPTAFITKINGAIRESKLAIARYNWLRNTKDFKPQGDGKDGDRAALKMPMPRFQRMIEDDTMNLFNQIQKANPGAPREAIQGAVKEQLKQKYGIDA